MASSMNHKFWQEKWRHKMTHWDLGQAHPLLIEGIDTLKRNRFLPDGFSVAIPACGRCHEGAWLADTSPESSVLGYDIEPLAIEQAKSLCSNSNRISLRVLNHFNLPAELEGRFDLVLDRAALCAFPPDKQLDFFTKEMSLVRPGGFYISAPFIKVLDVPTHEPPFELKTDVLKWMLSENFHLITHRTIDTKSPVVTREALTILQKKV